MESEGDACHHTGVAPQEGSACDVAHEAWLIIVEVRGRGVRLALEFRAVESEFELARWLFEERAGGIGVWVWRDVARGRVKAVGGREGEVNSWCVAQAFGITVVVWRKAGVAARTGSEATLASTGTPEVELPRDGGCLRHRRICCVLAACGLDR